MAAPRYLLYQSVSSDTSLLYLPASLVQVVTFLSCPHVLYAVPVSRSVRQFVRLFSRQFVVVRLSVRFLVSLYAFCLFSGQFVCQFVGQFVCQFVCQFVRLSVCILVSFFISFSVFDFELRS